jgi:transposase
MVKITSVARDGRKATSVVAMVQALIEGERDPRTLADLAKGPLRGKRDQLAEALDGMSGSHHGVIARMLLDQVAVLDQRITAMEDQAIAALAQVEQSWGVDATGETGPQAGTSPDSPVLAAAYRLAEIPGISVWLAIVIIAEIGLTMTVFPTPAHLVAWMGLCRSAAQSGTRHGKGSQKSGTSYARAAAGQAALGAARTATFPGERYARIARRRGKAIAQAAVARSIMLIVWHLLSDPAARYRDLGPDWHARQAHQPGQEDPHPPPGPPGPRRHHRHHRRRTGRPDTPPRADPITAGPGPEPPDVPGQTSMSPHRSAAALQLAWIFLVSRTDSARTHDPTLEMTFRVVTSPGWSG